MVLATDIERAQHVRNAHFARIFAAHLFLQFTSADTCRCRVVRNLLMHAMQQDNRCLETTQKKKKLPIVMPISCWILSG